MQVYRKLFATALVFAAAALAQLYTGSITGTVSDPSGAVVPNCRITALDVEKGFSFSTTSDSTGRYVLPSIPPGKYRVSIEADGFQPQVHENISMEVGQNVRVDFPLQVKTSSQSVEIKGEAPVLQSEDATTGQVINRRFINDLPLIDRNVLSLAYLTPGIVPTDTNSGGNDFVSNGGRNATADVLMDGVSTTNFEQNSGIQVPSYTPSVEAVEEFSVETANFSAEYGFSGSTIVNMVTRSGTNQFHGSAYDFLRNQVLDANNFFNNASGIPIAPLKRNNFGVTLGGPIRRDKTFFFMDYDGSRQTTMSTGNVFGVPSAAERQGNFGELCAAQGGSFDATGMCSAPTGQLWDPYSGTYSSALGGIVHSAFVPFNNLASYVSPGNPNLSGTPHQLQHVPGNLIDPVAFKLMQYFPLPNLNVGTGSYDPYNNYLASGPVHSQNDQFDVKLDHRFNDHDLLSVKYSHDLASGDSFNCFGNIADPCTQGPYSGGAHLVAINETHTISPTMLMTFSYGWNRVYATQGGIAGNYPNINPVTMLGLPSYMLRSGFPAFPAITLTDYSNSNGWNIGTQPWSILGQGNDTHQLLATFSWMKGSHELKFGVEGRLHRINFDNPGPTGGLFYFDRNSTSQTPGDGSGDALASFLTGVSTPSAASGNSFYEVPNFVSSQNLQWGGFIQDNWKITSRLTLNLGFRYDVSLPRTERYNRMNWVDPNVVSPLQVPGLGTLHGGEVFASSNQRNNYDPDLTNFQPRFGFAWQALKNTVVRGGYGIFYSTTKAGAAGPGAWGYQGFVEDTPQLVTYQNDLSTPWGRLSDPFPGVGPKFPPGSSLGLLNDVGFGAIGPVPYINATPYSQTWSFGIQRELPWSILLDTSYVGTKGTHLYFGGAGDYNHLGPWVEQLSLDQIGNLNNSVANPFYGIITDPNSSLSGPTVQQYQLLRPFPQFTAFGTDPPPVANSIYNALQARLEKRFSSGVQFLFTYTFSKSIDDASVTDGNITWLGGRTSLQDPNNYHLERSVSLFDDTHVFQFSYTFALPFGRGRKFGSNWNPVVNGVLGGWQTNGIWRFDSGFPISLAQGVSGSYNVPIPTYGVQRADLVATPQRNNGSNWLTQYFADPTVFQLPNAYTVGNAPRTLPWVRQPGMANTTMSVFKEFSLSSLREGSRLEFRVEAFNALNHVMFAGPNTTVGSGNFGQITSTNGAVSPREVQIALKFYW